MIVHPRGVKSASHGSSPFSDVLAFERDAIPTSRTALGPARLALVRREEWLALRDGCDLRRACVNARVNSSSAGGMVTIHITQALENLGRLNNVESIKRCCLQSASIAEILEQGRNRLYRT